MSPPVLPPAAGAGERKLHASSHCLHALVVEARLPNGKGEGEQQVRGNMKACFNSLWHLDDSVGSCWAFRFMLTCFRNGVYGEDACC